LALLRKWPARRLSGRWLAIGRTGLTTSAVATAARVLRRRTWTVHEPLLPAASAGCPHRDGCCFEGRQGDPPSHVCACVCASVRGGSMEACSPVEGLPEESGGWDFGGYRSRRGHQPHARAARGAQEGNAQRKAAGQRGHSTHGRSGRSNFAGGHGPDSQCDGDAPASRGRIRGGALPRRHGRVFGIWRCACAPAKCGMPRDRRG
jgi:hypothetical protein